jgi:hypothetical protein
MQSIRPSAERLGALSPASASQGGSKLEARSMFRLDIPQLERHADEAGEAGHTPVEK